MNKLQKIGASQLVIALVLTWMNEPGFAYMSLIPAGVIDLYLVWKDKKTISQWIQGLWPKKIDYPILGVLLAFTFYMFFKDYGFVAAMQASLPLIIVWLSLHLFANKY